MSEGQVELPTNFDRPIPTWVPEPVRNRTVDQKDRQGWLRSVNEELHSNLNLTENLPNVAVEKVEGLYGWLSNSIVESAEQLHIPIPGVRTNMIWSLYRNLKAQGKFSDRDASVSADEYSIKFDPSKLEELLEMKPFSQKIESDLVVRHEMFHLWEIIHQPEDQGETRERLELIRAEQPEIYKEVKQTLTGKEMRAKMIELDVLKNEDTKTIRQFLLKSFLILVTKAELIQREKRRKQLGISF